jgi:hypothetical protein
MSKWSYTSTPPHLAFISGQGTFTITACFVVNCVRSLIPKDFGVLQKFYDIVHPSSKPPASKVI